MWDMTSVPSLRNTHKIKNFMKSKHITPKILCYQSKEEKTMVNKKFWLGILVMVLVFGMTVVGCDDKSEPKWYEGTWNYSTFQLVVSGNSYTLKDSSFGNVSKGTLSVTGNETSGTINFVATHTSFDGTSWVAIPGGTLSDSGNYTKSGNTLIISGLTTLSTADGTWTKK
jgi:hypothetical protein